MIQDTKREVLNRSPEVIAFLQDLADHNQTGEALFQSGEESGKVYLHHGLVVWAFATGQRESFQSILLKENLLSKERLLDGIKESRRTGKRNLDDILHLLGIVDPEERTTIVERHTRAAMAVIAKLNHCVAQFSGHSDGRRDDRIAGLELDQLLRDEKTYTNGHATNGQGAQTARTQSSAPKQSEHTPVRNLNELLERFRFEIPNFLAAMVIDGATSMPISTLSDAPDLDIEVVGAFYCDLTRAAREALKAMAMEQGAAASLQEILITTDQNYILLRTLQDASSFLYVMVDQDSNPGMAKVVVRRYLADLERLLG